MSSTVVPCLSLHAPEAAHRALLVPQAPPTPFPFRQPVASWQASTTAVLTIKFMFKRSARCKVYNGEMVKLKAGSAPRESLRVRKPLGHFFGHDETPEEFEARRTEDKWKLPTVDELGPHPPSEPNICSNIGCTSKLKIAPDGENGKAPERQEYYDRANKKWVGFSEVGTTKGQPSPYPKPSSSSQNPHRPESCPPAPYSRLPPSQSPSPLPSPSTFAMSGRPQELTVAPTLADRPT